MAVMDTIRRGTDSTLMKVVFGAIVLVFVLWGITPQGAQSQLLAEVNGERITDTELNRAMRGQDRGMDEADLEMLRRQVVEELIRQRVLVQEAERIGLEVSLEEIAREVARNPNFKDANGKFDPKMYETTLKHMGMTRGGYEEALREDILIRKLMQLALSTVRVGDAELKRQFDRTFTNMSVRWVNIPNDVLLDDVPIDDAAVQEWIAGHADEIKAAYDRDFNTRWSRPRQAEISTILLRTDLDQGRVPEEELQKRLETVRQQALGGADFGALARRWSEDLSAVSTGGNIGAQTEVQMGEDLAKAVMAAGEGGITEVVRTARGLQIAKVHKITEPQVIPIEEAQKQIAQERLGQERVSDFGTKVAEELLAAWKSSGQPPAELLGRYGLDVEEATGFPPGQPPLNLASQTAFLAALEDATAPGVLDGVHPSQGGRVIGEVTAIEEPNPEMYEQLKDFLATQLRQEAQQAFLERYADDLVDRAEVKRTAALAP